MRYLRAIESPRSGRGQALTVKSQSIEVDASDAMSSKGSCQQAMRQVFRVVAFTLFMAGVAYVLSLL
jgi:hypothetical protein